MKLKISILIAVLCTTTSWAQLPQQKAEQMRTEAEMTYFNLESVKSAYKDFCKSSSYDATTYGAKLQELEQLVKA